MSEFIGQHPENWGKLSPAQRESLEPLARALADIPWTTRVVAVSVEDLRWVVEGEEPRFKLLAEAMEGSYMYDYLHLAAGMLGPNEGRDDVAAFSEKAIGLLPEKFRQELAYSTLENRMVLPLWEREPSQQ